MLIAGTGYQYGDTDFLEYSERLYRDLAHELRAGAVGTGVPIGEALAAAKRTYITGTQDIRGIHEKAVLEATLFGLPMFGVDLPDGPHRHAGRRCGKHHADAGRRRACRRARPRHR